MANPYNLIRIPDPGFFIRIRIQGNDTHGSGSTTLVIRVHLIDLVAFQVPSYVAREEDGVVVQMHKTFQQVDHLSVTAESGKKLFLSVADPDPVGSEPFCRLWILSLKNGVILCVVRQQKKCS